MYLKTVLVQKELSLRISPYSVRMRENTDQNNSEYGHFLRGVQFSRRATKNLNKGKGMARTPKSIYYGEICNNT